MPKLKIKLKTADTLGIVEALILRFTKTPDTTKKLMLLTLRNKITIIATQAGVDKKREYNLNLPMEYADVLHDALVFTPYFYYTDEIPQQITSYLQIQNALP
jgi:hypothetical protein